jgi:Kef-type K+ transport system membrane component KefB
MSDNLIMGVFVLVAALIGFRFGIAVSIFEIAAGIIAGNFLGVKPNEWLNHFAEFGSLLLIFLAGSDIDVDFMLRRLKPVLIVGTISFLAPLLAVLTYGHFIAHWERDKLILISIASSSTSVAVVYPVLRDAGLLKVPLGKLMLLVAFLPDFLITVALFVFFTKFGWDTLAVIAALVALIVIIRHASFRFLGKYAASALFKTLADEARRLNSELAAIRFCMLIRGLSVTVSSYNGEPDYSEVIEETFAKFKHGAATDYRVKFPEYFGVDHVGAMILERIALFHPDVFASLDDCL